MSTISNLTITGSDNGLSPDRRQAIIWTNDGLLWIGLLGTNFGEILIEIHTFSFKKMCMKMLLSAKWRPFCLGLNVLTRIVTWIINHIYSNVWNVITHSGPNNNSSLTQPQLDYGMNEYCNYIPLCYEDVIACTYLYPSPDDGLANICS